MSGEEAMRYRNTIRVSYIMQPRELAQHAPQPQRPHRHSPRDQVHPQEQRGEQVPEWLLTRYHDQSYVKLSPSQQKKHKCLRLWYRIVERFGYIYPESPLLLVWNLLVVVAIVFNYYEIPISMFYTEAVYKSEFDSAAGLLLNTLFTICIVVNTVLVRPLTAYYSQGRLITSTKSIINRYLKLQFWLNIVAWLALFAYIFSESHTFVYVKLLFYLSALGLARIDSLILYKVEGWRMRSALYKLLRLIAMLLFVLFWIASVFFAIDYALYLGQGDYFPTNLWLTNTVACQYADLSFINLVELYSWPVWLNYSMYWVLQTVSGLGYGDITPRNPIEVAYCDIVIVIFCLFYALFVNSVWQVIVELLGNTHSHKNKIIRHYEKNYSLDKDMVVKLENYIFEAEKEKEKEEKEQEINEFLSDELRNQLQLARQKRLYVGISFFNELATLSDEYAEFLYNLANLTREARYGEGEVIFPAGKSNVDLCRLVEGGVLMQYEHSRLSHEIKSKTKQNFFGVADFLLRSNSTFSARTTKYSKISYLSQGRFLETLKLNPKIREKYQQLYEDIKFYGRHELSSEDCWACGSPHHATTACDNYFQWLGIYRDVGEVLRARELGRNKIAFRVHQARKRDAMKRVILVAGPAYPDLLSLKNTNRTDQVKGCSHYRPQFNI